MPFIGQDWRSPGDNWVKTQKGSWERLKLLDNASQFLGFQSSSDSSSLDSDSSDNEAGPTFMESEPQSANPQQFGDNLTDDLIDEKAGPSGLESNIFLLNSQPHLIKDHQQFKENLSEHQTLNSSHSGAFHEPPIRRIITTVVGGQVIPSQSSSINPDEGHHGNENDYTITEFNSTAKRTKNTSIQNIIIQYERQQQLMASGLKKPSSSSPQSCKIERQSSFDDVLINLEPPLLKAIKQRHLFPSKSIDQPMDLEGEETCRRQSTSKLSFVKKNFEKLLNPLSQLKQQKEEKKASDTSKIASLHEKSIEKPTKHMTIKQCIRKIDLNTTHQNILKHLENDVSLNQGGDSTAGQARRDGQATNKPAAAESSIRTNKSSSELSALNSQPHCPIILKHTKEIAGYNHLNDAFLRLDFYNAIRDIRRFNYVCKLLHLLITQNLTSLSGCATKFLFNLLEEIAFQVAGNQQNIHILHTLLRDVQKIMKKYYCWGRPIGSTVLWECHLKTIENICQIVKNIEIKPPPKNGKGFRDLPAELIRTILLQLSDYKDLMNSGQVNDAMKSFLDEQYIWRELCKYHFSNRQIKHFLKDNQGNKNFILERPINEIRIRRSNADNLNWEKVFHSLRKKFGLKEEYADSLFLCRHCRSLFWRQLGHPCLIAQMLEEEMNKENAESGQFISNENHNHLRPTDGQQSIRIQERVQQVRPMNPLINNQIDLNRQINNLNRMNNHLVNNEIRQANNGENQPSYVPQVSDSAPISPEAFLKFFSL